MRLGLRTRTSRGRDRLDQVTRINATAPGSESGLSGHGGKLLFGNLGWCDMLIAPRDTRSAYYEARCGRTSGGPQSD
jgi:hypothetical protein